MIFNCQSKTRSFWTLASFCHAPTPPPHHLPPWLYATLISPINTRLEELHHCYRWDFQWGPWQTCAAAPNSLPCLKADHLLCFLSPWRNNTSRGHGVLGNRWTGNWCLWENRRATLWWLQTAQVVLKIQVWMTWDENMVLLLSQPPDCIAASCQWLICCQEWLCVTTRLWPIMSVCAWPLAVMVAVLFRPKIAGFICR